MRLKAENALAGDDTRQKPALTAILTQIARLDRLIAELLAMTQRRTSTPVPTPLKLFLQTCIADYRTITIETPDTTVTVDPDLLRRALDSLLQNAAHHTPPAGTITLRATTTPTTLHLEIADTGPGVSENLKKTLFDPFVTGRSDGTGLGLAIARELIQAMHGIITLAPTTPGATFLIDLPCPPS